MRQLVVGGQTAEPFQFPFVLSLEFLGTQSCGATLLSAEWALTAAHCVAGNPTEVYVGLYLHGSAILAVANRSARTEAHAPRRHTHTQTHTHTHTHSHP